MCPALSQEPDIYLDNVPKAYNGMKGQNCYVAVNPSSQQKRARGATRRNPRPPPIKKGMHRPFKKISRNRSLHVLISKLNRWLTCFSPCVLECDDVLDVPCLREEVERLDVHRFVPVGDDLLRIASLNQFRFAVFQRDSNCGERTVEKRGRHVVESISSKRFCGG